MNTTIHELAKHIENLNEVDPKREYWQWEAQKSNVFDMIENAYKNISLVDWEYNELKDRLEDAVFTPCQFINDIPVTSDYINKDWIE